jgi:putative PIN family toxin of toxin-antitoxin system
VLAVLDTNLLVSAFILKRGVPHDILVAWRANAFAVVTTELLYQEIDEVLRRPKFVRTYAATVEEISDYLSFIRSRSWFVEPASIVVPPVRDPDDELLLRVALGGQADYLVTGDNDLIALAGNEALGDLRVVTPRAFLDLVPAVDAERGS